jgi:hypothetical protein
MDLGENHPKSTIPIPMFDAVPIRAIGGTNRGGVCGRWSHLENARLGVGSGSHVVVEEGVQLGELKLDVVQWCVHLRRPGREHLVELWRRGLENRHALLTLLVHEHEVVEALVDGGLLRGEADTHFLPHLLHLIDQHLDVGIHRIELLLPPGEVVVIF